MVQRLVLPVSVCNLSKIYSTHVVTYPGFFTFLIILDDSIMFSATSLVCDQSPGKYRSNERLADRWYRNLESNTDQMERFPS